MVDNEFRDFFKVEDEDLDIGYDELLVHLENTTHHQKTQFEREIIENGNDYLRQIEKEKKVRKNKLKKEIEYIIKKTNFSFNEIIEYDEKDILDIYKITKDENRSLIGKIFKFILQSN